eukprot:UC1_evm1s548
MGNLMQVLRKEGRRPGEGVFVNFEKAEPTEAEAAVYGRVDEVLSRASGVLADLETYSGAVEAIRQAIQHPDEEEKQTAAWDTVCPLVSKLKDFFLYASEIERVLPLLLEALCADDPITALETKQALTKQFAEVLHFVLRFDDLKMTNPAVQNDFSYYRRTLSRMKMTGGDDSKAVVSNEEANRMSLFYAFPTPMLRAVSDATTKFVSDNKSIPIENTTDCLATMAAVCRVMITAPEIYSRFDKEDTIPFCQRVMTGLIILYDHVHLVGAFSKKNPSIDIKSSIKALKLHNNPAQEGLLNALRFSTKHLNDDDTPKAIKQLLSA